MNKLDPCAIKADFPLLGREVHGHQIVYLDSAATSQKPRQVIDAMDDFYRTVNSNVHRSAYYIAERATAMTEAARAKIQHFIGAESTQEVIFTKNATESCNLVVNSMGRARLNPGDAVLLTMIEHHANIVPWHILSDQLGLELRWLPVGEDGHLDLTRLDELLDGVKMVGISAMSNVIGTVPPIRQIADAAHAHGAIVLCDGCQFVPHRPCDVTDLGVDFMAFSGHKMCGPTGIGVLWGRQELLEEMPPFLGGGEMILDVTTEGFLANKLPWKFEAGTPPIAEIVGLGAAVEYLSGIGMESVSAHEIELTSYAFEALDSSFGDDIVLHGPKVSSSRVSDGSVSASPVSDSSVSDSFWQPSRGSTISFAYRDVHPHDVSQILDQYGVCVRAGHHCAKPLMRHLGVQATARASLYIYNTKSDVDRLVEMLGETGNFF